MRGRGLVCVGLSIVEEMENGGFFLEKLGPFSRCCLKYLFC